MSSTSSGTGTTSAWNVPSRGGGSTSVVTMRRSRSSGGVGWTSPNPSSSRGSTRVPSHAGAAVAAGAGVAVALGIAAGSDGGELGGAVGAGVGVAEVADVGTADGEDAVPRSGGAATSPAEPAQAPTVVARTAATETAVTRRSGNGRSVTPRPYPRPRALLWTAACPPAPGMRDCAATTDDEDPP